MMSRLLDIHTTFTQIEATYNNTYIEWVFAGVTTARVQRVRGTVLHVAHVLSC